MRAKRENMFKSQSELESVLQRGRMTVISLRKKTVDDFLYKSRFNYDKAPLLSCIILKEDSDSLYYSLCSATYAKEKLNEYIELLFNPDTLLHGSVAIRKIMCEPKPPIDELISSKACLNLLSLLQSENDAIIIDETLWILRMLSLSDCIEDRKSVV